MNHYLLIYGRREGRLLAQEEFRDGRAALRGRFAAEARYADDPDVEVVVLGSRSLEGLKKTHARYFASVQDIAASALR
ncbi:hypothetical protein [Streptosporangium saharense]|uniref:Uncharacterized protein n=1 Tax=Streptosporangium saharense TaxID=1706840 RepID=A0A7W7VK51_9ACTN|nr:hypothetical protein [Streptosporangium saharense]MBB4912989.1 hypothetical protein [Streptosporangium saharense]